MRFYRVDLFLAVGLLLSAFWFLGADQVMNAQVTCDNKCRMRRYFYDSVGPTCDSFQVPDCLHCTCVACQCYPIDGEDTSKPCGTVTGGSQRVMSPTYCPPNCTVPKGWVVESKPTTYFNGNTTNLNTCH